jgi:hypothetical protein
MRLLSCVRQSVLPIMLMAGMASAQLMSGKNFDVIRVEKVGITQGKVDSLAKMLGEQQAKGRSIPLKRSNSFAGPLLIIWWVRNFSNWKSGNRESRLRRQRLTVWSSFSSHISERRGVQQGIEEVRSDSSDVPRKGRTTVAERNLLEKKVPYPSNPTEKQIAAYWELNKNKVSINDTISGAKIILKIKKGESAQELADKKDMLKGLAAQVRSNKATFAQLAAQYSDDPTARKTGGVINKVLPKSMGQEFVKGISKLKVGDISDVITTNEGVLIFMLTEKNDGKMESYRHQIDYILRVQAEQERQMSIKAYLDELARTYKVQYLNSDYTPPEAIGGKK